jgi:hypothetical protein
MIPNRFKSSGTSCLVSASSASFRRQVVEADEVDPVAITMPGHLQQIDDAEEAGFSRQPGRNGRGF